MKKKIVLLMACLAVMALAIPLFVDRDVKAAGTVGPSGKFPQLKFAELVFEFTEFRPGVIRNAGFHARQEAMFQELAAMVKIATIDDMKVLYDALVRLHGNVGSGPNPLTERGKLVTAICQKMLDTVENMNAADKKVIYDVVADYAVDDAMRRNAGQKKYVLGLK